MKRNINTILFYLFSAGILAFLISSCTNDYTPKPRGYFRIDLPEKSYRVLDSIFPYSFEYPVYAVIEPDYLTPHEPYWINLEYPAFRGVIHLTYKEVHNDLEEHLENTRSFVIKHIPKANAIREEVILNRESHVYGIKYTISGTDAASAVQFFVTDSVHHFLRGALYFNTEPNNDSLKPVIDFISADIDHLVETLKWKE